MQSSTWLALIAAALFALWLLLGPHGLSRPPQAAQPMATRSALLPDFVLEFPSGSLVSITASGDGRRLAVARNFVSQQDGRNVNMTELRLFDLDSGQALWAASYENPNCCGLPVVKMTSEGPLLILGAGKQLHLYNQDGHKLKTFSYAKDDEFTLLSAALSADGEYIAATSAQRAYLFSREGQQLWSAEFAGVPTLALSRAGTYLLVATNERFALYRTADLQLVREGALSYADPVVAVAISDDGSAWAIAGNSDTDTLIVRVLGTEPERQLVLGAVNAPRLSFVGSRLLIEGALGGEAALIDLSDGNLQRFPKQSDSAHIALQGDHVAIARGRVIELRRLSDNALLWQRQVLGTVVMLWLGSDKLIALGNEQGDSALPNRIWVWTMKGVIRHAKLL